MFRQDMNADKEIVATWMGSFPSIRVHLRMGGHEGGDSDKSGLWIGHNELDILRELIRSGGWPSEQPIPSGCGSFWEWG